ncbi:GntR family transcriptional regulator [Mycolicibacterium goodii]|uniref:GntR family transcriptional regulator n=1 Tax=Mycolicibacterium goodii TaxID=134601 RepID=UPI00130422B4|nr:GntR family transcriptional regulator [Mycolicibacterium goodii]
MPRKPEGPTLGLAPKSLDTLAANAIRDRILNGRLEPATHLVEAELAEELGVSAGTIRSGFRVLQYEGLVQHRPNRGVYVTDMTVEDAWEIYSLRNNLEGIAARLAAQRIDLKGRAKLKRVLHVMREAAERDDRMTLAQSDLELHELIVDLAAHSRLKSAHQVIHAQTTLFMLMTKDLHGDAMELIGTHEKLINAIVTGDADAAEILGRTHSTEDGERLRERLLLNHELTADKASEAR